MLLGFMVVFIRNMDFGMSEIYGGAGVREQGSEARGQGSKGKDRRYKC